MSNDDENVTKVVDAFVRRFYDLEIKISPEACKVEMKSKTVFADLLGNSIAGYMLEKQQIENLVKTAQAKQKLTQAEMKLAKDAYNCFLIITKAYAGGFVEQGSNLLEKLDSCRKQNVELMKDLAKCMANYTSLKWEHERLLAMLGQNQSEELKKQEESNEQTQNP
jgi:hypothetical protein